MAQKPTLGYTTDNLRPFKIWMIHHYTLNTVFKLVFGPFIDWICQAYSIDNILHINCLWEPCQTLWQCKKNTTSTLSDGLFPHKNKSSFV